MSRFLFLYDAARTANKLRKKYKKERAGKRLSPVRRIEFVHPVPGQRVVSMTFDDGPMAMGCNPPKGGKGLTEYLLGVMAKYGARGTFDVVGSTADNYPDTEGALGSFNWGGCKSDHYPMFGWDKLAGAIDCPQLIRAILDAGHEISNHSCTHHLFGPMNLVYRQRRSFDTIDQVVGDLRRLHDHLQQEFGYTMRLSRPPHYIDAIPDGFNAYDAYQFMGYQYMAAGFDGGGWKASCGDYQRDVDAMVRPLEQMLRENPDRLNGQIISQKDGFNMSRQTPVADALGRQLELLQQFGYRVVPVSELIALSPFEDLDPACPQMEHVRALLELGCVIGYKNNSFQPQRPVTGEEITVMTTPPAVFRRNLGTPKACDPYRMAQGHGVEAGRGALSGRQMMELAEKHHVELTETGFRDKPRVPRLDAMELVRRLAEQKQAK